MLRLIVGKRAGQRETPRLGTRVAAAREIEVHEMWPPEPRVALDDEDGMAADDDRKRDAGHPRDGARPEPGRVDDHRSVDAITRGCLDRSEERRGGGAGRAG